MLIIREILFVLSRKDPEHLENSKNFPESSLPCQKKDLEASTRFQIFLEKLILAYDIILIAGFYQNVPSYCIYGADYHEIIFGVISQFKI